MKTLGLVIVGLAVGAALAVAFTGFEDTVTQRQEGQQGGGHAVTMSCSSIAVGGDHLGNFPANLVWEPDPCKGEATARRRVVLGGLVAAILGGVVSVRRRGQPSVGDRAPSPEHLS